VSRSAASDNRDDHERKERVQGMGATFFGNETAPSPDEIVDRRKPPICPRCHIQMWLTEFTRKESDQGSKEIRGYQCKQCGFDASTEVLVPLRPQREALLR